MPCESKAQWSVPVEVTFSSGVTDELELLEWYVFMCQACLTPVVLSSWDGEELEVKFPSPDPSELTKIANIPDQVRDDLIEAESCYHANLPNAFGAMARRVIHSICEDKGAFDQNLFDQITALVGNGIFSQEIGERAHALRTLGRNAAHPEWEPVTQEMAREGIELLYWLVRTVYGHSNPPPVPQWADLGRRRRQNDQSASGTEL